MLLPIDIERYSILFFPYIVILVLYTFKRSPRIFDFLLLLGLTAYWLLGLYQFVTRYPSLRKVLSEYNLVVESAKKRIPPDWLICTNDTNAPWSTLPNPIARLPRDRKLWKRFIEWKHCQVLVIHTPTNWIIAKRITQQAGGDKGKKSPFP